MLALSITFTFLLFSVTTGNYVFELKFKTLNTKGLVGTGRPCTSSSNGKVDLGCDVSLAYFCLGHSSSCSFVYYLNPTGGNSTIYQNQNIIQFNDTFFDFDNPLVYEFSSDVKSIFFWINFHDYNEGERYVFIDRFQNRLAVQVGDHSFIIHGARKLDRPTLSANYSVCRQKIIKKILI